MMNIIKKLGLLLTGVLFMACAGSPDTAEVAVAPSVPSAASAPAASDALSLDAVIVQAARRMEQRLPGGTKVAIVSVASPSTAFSGYVIDSLEAALVDSGAVKVVDRANLEKIRAEQGFQLSGDVSDESAKAIGQMLGADAIVTGSLLNLGDEYRLTLKAINIESAEVAVSYPADIANDKRVQALLASGIAPGAGSGAATSRPAAGQAAAGTPSGSAGSGTPAPAASVIAIEVTAKTGGALFFQDKEIANLWDNETHTIPIEGPGTYALKMVYGDHAESRSVSINSRGVTKVTFGVTYTVGQTGPAGGIVFYDKGNYGDGWRYLEAAPAVTEFKAQWGADNKTVGGTSISIGSGKKNTQLIVNALERFEETGRAAQSCVELNFGEFKDWFLPSQSELNMMYQNLKTKGIGGFDNAYYWTSSQIAGGNSWCQFFDGGKQTDSSYYSRKDNAYSVRAVRQF